MWRITHLQIKGVSLIDVFNLPELLSENIIADRHVEEMPEKIPERLRPMQDDELFCRNIMCQHLNGSFRERESLHSGFPVLAFGAE
jgi:hypothetical protein